MCRTIQIQALLLSGWQHKDYNYAEARLFLCRFLSLSLSLMVSTVGDTEIHSFKCIIESQQLSFIVVSLSFFFCALFLPRTCANVCTMSQGQKGFGRVSQTNRHWKGYKRWQFILELPLPVFCSSARNGPAVVSNMLPETHFKGTSYCELVKGRLEGRPNISDIKYFPPPQTENYITLSPFTTSSISTHFISESVLQ